MRKFDIIAKNAKDFFTTGHLNIPLVLDPVMSKGRAGGKKVFEWKSVINITY
jgi:hypothetical protein